MINGTLESLPLSKPKRIAAAIFMAFLASAVVGAYSHNFPFSMAMVRFLGEGLVPSLLGALLLTRVPYIRKNVGLAITIGLLYWVVAGVRLIA